MSDGLLPIGMFSRASSVSVKALRAYHEAGILVPARVDPRTGYRAYTVDQLTDAAIVVRLRALDVPLDQVRRVLQARDPAVTRAVLDAHRATMEARLATTERIVAELHSTAAPVAHTPVHVRREPARLTLCVRGEVPPDGFGPYLERTFTELGVALVEAGALVDGPAGALYRAELPDDAPEPVEAFVPIAEACLVPPGAAARGVVLGEVPEATVAVLVHVGGYGSIGETYRALGAWVARHAEPAPGERVREWYVVGPGDGADPAGFRTEIGWPIVAPTAPTGGP